jgi:hypothetical protein
MHQVLALHDREASPEGQEKIASLVLHPESLGCTMETGAETCYPGNESTE